MGKEFCELVGLAHARYPDSDPAIAVLFFESDRRRAGLGALDERKRHGNEIHRRKFHSQGRVIYHLEINRRARYELPPMELSPFLLENVDPEATFTQVYVPEVHKAFRLPVDGRDLFRQAGRRIIARQLMDARRQLRAAVAGGEGGKG